MIQNVEKNATNLLNTCTNESSLDTTQGDLFNETYDSDINNQGEFIEATNTFQDDLDDNLFYDTVSTGKRSGKCKLLKEEVFDNSVYKNKQCGFSTNRPLYWAQQVEKYVNQNSDVTGKVFYKVPKCNTEKYAIVKFAIYYQTNKQI